MAYAKGDVVLVPFPFRDQVAAKVRPALVVSGDAYNARGDLLVAAITTHPPRAPSDYALTGWRRAHLVAPSTVRIQLATLAAARVLYRPGRLSSRDIRAVDARLRAALDLELDD
jgi:mRNA-degrading endonuclease toxin of MazEF toxin-antitoxin module